MEYRFYFRNKRTGVVVLIDARAEANWDELYDFYAKNDAYEPVNVTPWEFAAPIKGDK